MNHLKHILTTVQEYNCNFIYVTVLLPLEAIVVMIWPYINITELNSFCLEN